MENIPDDKEITSYMNFDKVVSKYKIVTLWKKLTIGVISTGGTALIISTVIYFSGNDQKIQNSEETIVESQEPVNGILTENSTSGLSENSLILDSADSGQPTEIQPLYSDKEPEAADKTINSETPKRVEITEEGQSYNYIFKKASPVVGYDSLYRYLQEGMILPESSENLKGKVVVAFSIDTLGLPVNIKIIEGLTDEINLEAIRLIQNMPVWSPAELNGKPVETSLSIPILVEIVKSNKHDNH